MPGISDFLTWADAGTAMSAASAVAMRSREYMKKPPGPILYPEASYGRSERPGLLFDRDRDGVFETDGQGGTGRQRRMVAPARHHSPGAGARADGAANGRALGAAEDAADDRAADRAAANLRGTLAAGRVAFTQHGFRMNWHARAVGQYDRGEAHTKPCAVAHFAAALDERDFALGASTRRNRHAIADLHVARDASHYLVFEPRVVARHRGFHLQTDDGLRRNHQFFEHGSRWLNRTRRLALALGNGRGRDRGQR